MALKMKYEMTVKGFDQIVSKADCYWRVAQVTGDKNEVSFHVNIFDYKNNVVGQALGSSRYAFVPNMNGSNFIAQAYEHLKTLPEFSGATDV